MESWKYINENIDPYSEITHADYVPDYMGLKDFVSMICTAQSNSGKSVFIVNCLKHKFLHEFKLENIWFFSKTLKTDLTYRPIISYYTKKKVKPWIFTEVDFKMIDELIKTQEQIGLQ
jgi:hypothetical protein